MDYVGEVREWDGAITETLPPRPEGTIAMMESTAHGIEHYRNRHWEKPIKKTVFTLNIDNYEPAITELTFPMLRHFAKKIGADFHIINERKFPEWPVVYEKLQIYQLGREMENDWNLYIDADALVNPEMFDPTDHLHKSEVLQNGRDMAGVRWKYDQYFRRDGRHWGCCDWFAVASDWCLDLWHPLEDLTPEQAFANISITTQEHNGGCCKREHLIDDYTLSRNVARYDLKIRTLEKLCGELGWKQPKVATFQNGKGEVIPQPWGEKDANPFMHHLYSMPTARKLESMLNVLTLPQDRGGWALMGRDWAVDFKKRHNLNCTLEVEKQVVGNV